jgi:hypothetical protein
MKKKGWVKRREEKCKFGNYWVSGFCPPSGVLKNIIEHEVSETGVSLLSPADGHIFSFRNVVFSSVYWNIGQRTTTRNPVIPSVNPNRQNPLEYTGKFGVR